MTTTYGNISDSTPHGDARVRRVWPALTEALKVAGSPLRTYLAGRFPNTKNVFARYKEEVGPLLVPASVVSAVQSGTVGGAFDYLVRFLVDPAPDVSLPAVGAWRCGGRMLIALSELAATLGTSAPSDEGLDGPKPTTEFDGSRRPSVTDPELLARGCWALSLLTELARGVPVEASVLADLNPATVTSENLIGLASPAALDQLAALRQQAERVLLPALAPKTGRWSLGPTFEGSRLMNADADLIAAGTLIEIKTTLGRTKKDGTRYATLDGQTLFQLLGYVLLDFHDSFGIHELMLFSARYGHVVTWDLQELLDTLAGRPVDLATSRLEFGEFLRGGS
jgi:hypothetical protein